MLLMCRNIFTDFSEIGDKEVLIDEHPSAIA